MVARVLPRAAAFNRPRSRRKRRLFHPSKQIKTRRVWSCPPGPRIDAYPACQTNVDRVRRPASDSRPAEIDDVYRFAVVTELLAAFDCWCDGGV